MPSGRWPSLAREAPEIREQLLEVIGQEIRPAFERYRAVIVDEIAPNARPDDRPGLGHIPGGAEAYRLLTRAHTSLDIVPEDVHAVGLEEIRRIDAEFVELGARLLGTDGLAETLRTLREDPALHFATREEIEASARASLERANAAIGDWFGRLPKAPCEVVVMPAHEEKHSTIAYYRDPAADGSRPGQYYINTYAPGDATALRGRDPRLPRVRPGPPSPAGDHAGGRRAAGIPALQRQHGLHRGLGPLHRAPLGGDGPPVQRDRSIRRPQLRCLARRAAGRRHRHARAGLDAAAGDRLHGRAHRPRREQHRQRGGPIHQLRRVRRWPTSSASSRSCGCDRRPASARGTASTSSVSTTSSSSRALCPCPSCARSSSAR